MRPAIEVLAEVMDAYFREDRVENGEAAAAVIEADRAEVRAKVVAEIAAELRDEAHMAHIRRPDPDAALQAYAAALSNAADHIEAKFGGRDETL